MRKTQLLEAVLICLHCYNFRIDPTNACRVVIDVSSYSTVEEDRSVYKRADAWIGGWMLMSTPSFLHAYRNDKSTRW